MEFSADGKLRGGDHTFAYDGSWRQDGERFRAALSAKRVLPGPPGVLGMDEVDIIIVGLSNGSPSVACTALQNSRQG